MKKQTIIIIFAVLVIVFALPACNYLFTLHNSEEPIMDVLGQCSKDSPSQHLKACRDTPRGYHECTLTVKGTLDAGSFDFCYTNQITGEIVELTFEGTGPINYKMPVGDIGHSSKKYQQIEYDFSKDAEVNVTAYLEGKSYGYEILGEWLYGFVPK